MHVMEALRQLRDADQEWTAKGQEFTALRERLIDQSALEDRRQAQTDREALLSETRSRLNSQELELRSLEAHHKEVDRQLYADGSLSPRELDHMRHEAESLVRRIGELEESVLELMASMEQLQAAAEQGATELAAFEASYQAEHASNMARYRVLRDELRALRDRREALRGSIDANVLSLYDELWRSRQGSPLAMMVDGHCDTCRVVISREKARIVESYEPRVVTCDGCGRILILG